MTWPPTLDELKADLDTPGGLTRDDVALKQCLDAAIAFVRAKRPEFNYDNDPTVEAEALLDPTADLVLGTIRLAGRWFTRRRSPDGLVAMAELGSARVPSFDPDIERLLGLGRYHGPVFG